MLDLGVERLRLLTNNPDKVDGLRAAGLTVVERVPLIVAAQPESRRYLATKRQKMGRVLDTDPPEGAAAKASTANGSISHAPSDRRGTADHGAPADPGPEPRRVDADRVVRTLAEVLRNVGKDLAR